MKLLYRWMFRLRISEQGPRTRSKRGRSSLTHFSGPRATTVAARGLFSSRAISPGSRKKKARGQARRTPFGSSRGQRESAPPLYLFPHLDVFVPPTAPCRPKHSQSYGPGADLDQLSFLGPSEGRLLLLAVKSHHSLPWLVSSQLWTMLHFRTGAYNLHR